MNIYFAASIRGGNQDVAWYQKLIAYLKKYGNVLTEHIGIENIDLLESKTQSDIEIHDRDIEWLMQADVVVAEVTTPSLGVGYEIARAFDANIPIICFFRPQNGKKLSAMISGNKQIRVFEYQGLEDIEKYLDEIF